MFSGYNPVHFKLFVWTLSAIMCGIAGALYVPQVGIINPGEMSPANSIEIAIWTAVGGRGTLVGPVFGAAAVDLGKSWFTQALPEYWLLCARARVRHRHAVFAAWHRRIVGAAMSGSMSLQTGAGGDIRSGATDGRPPDARRRHVAPSDSLSRLGQRQLRRLSSALNKLSLTVDDGELRCVIGPNGAGKTTMMDVITGKTRPDEGTAFFGQTIDLTRLNEPEIAHAGIGRKFQKPTVFEQHTVFENLELAMKADKRVRPTLFARLDSSERDRIPAYARADPPECRMPNVRRLLSHGQKQWLEIGMLLMQEPRLLLLDEPVAGMTDEETMRSAELFLALAGEYTLVVVEHDMDFVAKIADRVTVLHEGRVLAEGSMHQVQQHEQVIEVFLGR